MLAFAGLVALAVHIVALASGCDAAAASYAPEQVHLGMAGPTDVDYAVTFATRNVSSSFHPIVKYGLSPGNMLFTVDARTRSEECRGPGPFSHSATLAHLALGTTYFYCVGSEAYGFSEAFSFTTHSGPAAPLRVVMFGDLGISYSNDSIARMADMAQRGAMDLIVFAGDIGYGDDRPDPEYQGVMNAFWNEVQPIFAHVPVLYAVGNHDTTCDRAAYHARVVQPHRSILDGGLGDFYTFDFAGIRFIALDTEHDEDSRIGPETEQYRWLERTLETPTATAMTIVFMHRPIYCSFELDQCLWHSTSMDPREWANPYRANLEPLLNKHGVKLFLNGHTHNYERTHAVLDNVPTAHATRYITVGSPGNIEPTDTVFTPEVPSWAAFRQSMWDPLHFAPFTYAGFAVFTVHDGVLTWRYIKSDDGTVLDTFAMTLDGGDADASAAALQTK